MSAATDLQNVNQCTLESSEARALTDQIKTGVEAVWHLITRAYTERAWSALGYTSWDDYCTREFGTSRLRLPREERQEVVSSLRDSGLSLRAIASVTGDSVRTVRRELSGVANATPDEGVESDEIAEALIVKDQELPPLPENYMAAPGAPTAATPGQTDRVTEALNRVQPKPEPALAPVVGIDGKRYPAKPTTPPAGRDTRRPLIDTARDLGLDIEKLAKRVEKFGADDRLVRNKNEVAPRLRNHLDSLIKVCQDLNKQLTQGA